MFDIGATELFLVAVVALVVVGPKELPRLLKTVGGLVRRMRELAAEFKDGVEQLATEAEQQTDPFADLRKKEGLRPGMSAEEVTNHIMRNREREAREKAEAKKASGAAKADTPKPDAGKDGAGKDDAS
ncbi:MULTISPECIES: Sec-independent protein translocase protein TatB [Kordiimonas]|jgi:sec-independent protein translocase protein TatB|uniref:Sec-independent protein translocase protein TatB n=1 Tax=Kordiimonas lacus TaxID=637679 RepID=A0A1G6VQR5_9PROT|nr:MULTISPECIES: Sec-independent protein translocase protein TatB [Kordiimonas]SDD55928.1 sec-independent protein translocase protein TatB [Kordiimonas lacus]